MNAPARIQAHTATPLWHDAPEARRLIASLRANPPELVERTERYAITTDRWTEYAPDSRIDRLRKIWNDAFLAAEREGGDAGAVAFLALPSVDCILADIGRHERLFLGVVVPPVPLSSFADLREDAKHPFDPANDCVFDTAVEIARG